MIGITIKSSGGLSEAQIQDMIKNAEKMKGEDAKRKEMVEMKNEAESLTYNTEKQLRENDAKLTQEVKDRIRSDITSVNEAITSNNHENLKNGLEKLRNSAMEMGRTIYQSGQQQSGPTDGQQQSGDQAGQGQGQQQSGDQSQNKEEKK
jgi:molecular chaperone DnaK